MVSLLARLHSKYSCTRSADNILWPLLHEKGKLAARRGRKATGLSAQEAAGPPKGDQHNTNPIFLSE
jgi:hypothetical protein